MPTHEPSGRICALLLTDIVDSTKTSQLVGDVEMARIWAAHDRAARDLLPRWSGREIDKSDGLLLLFGNVADAVGYALDYHHALAALDVPLSARAGVHVGSVTLRENSAADIALGAKPIEVDGLAKPIAARVMSVARGGQTLLTGEARHALGLSSLRVQSHGHWRLSGLSEAVELFEVGGTDAPFASPVDVTKAYRVVRQGDLWLPAREIRHSLPAERDSFVGRQEPLRILGQKLEGNARLISILGIGGAGKTRLAIHLAWNWLGAFPGGVWFCDLAQARSIDGLLFAVAQGLGITPSGKDALAQLTNAIAGRGKCLVVLDNFEQVTTLAEGTLGRWLDRAAEAKFLVTTREVLGIVGEETLFLEALSTSDAVALFLRRAETASRGYQPGTDGHAAIEQLVAMLDGLPLAIELAAARVQVMPPRAMLVRMDERFRVLASRAGRRDRQATLRATFDWSWDLLSEPEKAGLAQLSVFASGFTLESAQAVIEWSDSISDPPWSVDIVHSLVDKSLVRRVADDRFDLLESLRQYAAEHLRTEGRFGGSGPAALLAAEIRHGRFFATFDAQRSSESSCIELDNHVAACRRAAARGDGIVATHALSAAWGMIQMRGPFRVAVELAQVVGAVPGVDGNARVEVDLICGSALRLCGSAAEARVHIEAAAAAASRLSDPMLEARSLHSLGVIQAQSGALAEAEASYRRALTAFREHNEPLRECAILAHFGELCESTGRADEARIHYEAALRIARHSSSQRWEGGAAGNLGQFHANQGQPALARPLYARAIEVALELGDRQWEANARCNMGLLHHAQGRLADAQFELEAALAAAREMGHARLLSIVQCNLGLVAEAGGRTEEAEACHRAALAVARDLGDRRSEGQFLIYLGALLGRQSRLDEARDCLTSGEALFRALGDRVNLGILLCARAETEHLAGHIEAAEAALAQAVDLAAGLKDVEPESEFGQALRRVGQMLNVAA